LYGTTVSAKAREGVTTHVVAHAGEGRTDKVRWAERSGAHAVSIEWLTTCAATGTRADESAFSLVEPAKRGAASGGGGGGGGGGDDAETKEEDEEPEVSA
jgi:hypothetical protein